MVGGQAVAVGQLAVEHHAVDLLGVDRPCLGERGGLDDGEALELEGRADQSADAAVVVDDEDPGDRRHAR